MRPTHWMLAVSALMAASIGSAAAPAAPPASEQMTGQQAAGIVFTEVEKRLIRDYYEKRSGTSASDEAEDEGGHGKSKQMPPDLAKREHLPPGLQKHLEKNGRLPPGLAKRDLPANLVAQLPPAHAGTLRQIVGSDVVLIQEGTNVILDILENVLKKN